MSGWMTRDILARKRASQVRAVDGPVETSASEAKNNSGAHGTIQELSLALAHALAERDRMHQEILRLQAAFR